MKISIRKEKSPKVRKSRKAKSRFKLPKFKLPKLPKFKTPKMKLPKFKKMGEEHFVVMILAVVAVIAVVGLFMYMPGTEMNATGAAASYPTECDFRCGADEEPVGFVHLGSGNVECICKKVR